MKIINFIREQINPIALAYDNRQSWKTKYEISDIFVLVFIGLFCSYKNIYSISYFIKRNNKTFQKYGLLKDENSPSKTTIYRLLEIISWEEVQQLAYTCYLMLPDDIKNEVNDQKKITKIIDGKFIKASKHDNHRGYNVVSLYDPVSNTTIAQHCVSNHSSEKAAIPRIIKYLNPGDILSGDAIYCDQYIMNNLSISKINFVFSLKDNNKYLYNSTKLIIDDELFTSNKELCERQIFKTVKNGYFIKHIFEKLEYNTQIGQEILKQDKRGCLCILSCVKRTIIKYHKKTGKETISTSYYVSNMFNFKKIISAIMEHWSIESYHWRLDVSFGEDQCSVSNKNVSMILNILRKLVLFLIDTPFFDIENISTEDKLKVNLENLDTCIEKLI